MEVIMKPADHVGVKFEPQQEQQQQQQQHFHVLAVDDSLLDRKLLERLLKVSSYKDLKNLENYLLKTLDQSCQSDIVTENRLTANDDVESSNDTNSDDVIDSKINSNISVISKRKAVSPEPSETRRPKSKGLAVV
ncbi:hypothetical protein TIFTF001_014763 [Ficus carica]|uniref:Uncharacterized protein n=1 Tax=Ficus carica TaxID=3494 RepID=A0AA88AGM9_FICCA|nr:hypothetical protein TIFTF001_014763 [Ficus carica]